MIYLDHNATTPLRPAVREAMWPFLEEEFGNPSSLHRFGSRARAAVEETRRTVAAAIGARPKEVVFTSGGTESNNLAVLGVAASAPRPHLVVSPIEHASVLGAVRERARRGATIAWLPVDGDGRVMPEDLEAALTADTALVSIGWANNEIGTVQPIAELAAVCGRRGVPLHVDAVQALGKVAISVEGIALCSLSAHKLGGPKGVGALFVRDGVTVAPLCFGGSQERGRRPGTENVAGIVGLGAAVRAAGAGGAGVDRLRERLWAGLAGLPGVRRNSPAAGCLPNTLHLGFAGLRGETLVAALDLDGVAVSAGSACAAGAAEPSHVLRALGRSEDEAREGIRFSLGLDTTAPEIDRAIEIVMGVVERTRRVRNRVANG